MKEVFLTQGLKALVDDSDYAVLNAHKWFAHRDRSGNIYAVRNVNTVTGRSILKMHWAILGHKNIDHKDGDGLNNQRSNLRSATHQQNSINQPKIFVGTSKFKGVHWHKRQRKWIASIGYSGKTVYIGTFDDEVEAAKAYNKKAAEFFGEFSYQNSI